MQFVDKILFQINTEIEKLGIDDCMGIDSALHMMRFIQPLCDELRKYILAYQFADETEEISFFKEYKPEVLSKYLYTIKYMSLKVNILPVVILHKESIYIKNWIV